MMKLFNFCLIVLKCIYENRKLWETYCENRKLWETYCENRKTSSKRSNRQANLLFDNYCIAKHNVKLSND